MFNATTYNQTAAAKSPRIGYRVVLAAASGIYAIDVTARKSAGAIRAALDRFCASADAADLDGARPAAVYRRDGMPANIAALPAAKF